MASLGKAKQLEGSWETESSGVGRGGVQRHVVILQYRSMIWDLLGVVCLDIHIIFQNLHGLFNSFTISQDNARSLVESCKGMQKHVAIV